MIKWLKRLFAAPHHRGYRPPKAWTDPYGYDKIVPKDQNFK